MKNKFKAWIIDVKQKNTAITNKMLAEILRRTQKETENFLYIESRFPSFEDVFRLYDFVAEAKLNFPKEMQNYVFLVKAQSRGLAHKYFPLAEKSRSHDRAKRYIFNGELKTPLEIVKNTLEANNLRMLLHRKNIASGDDISQLVNDYIVNKKSNRGKIYIFEGQSMSMTEIAAQKNYSVSNVSIRLKNVAENSDVTEILNKSRKYNKREKNV